MIRRISGEGEIAPTFDMKRIISDDEIHLMVYAIMISLPIYDFHVAPPLAFLTRFQLFTKTGYLITFFMKVSISII